LFLFTLWIGFMLVGNNFTVNFALCGFFSALFVAIIAYQLKIIDDNSEMLFLSLGFYKHFMWLYFKNFLSSISLLFELAIQKKSLHPTLHRIKFKSNFRFNPALLIASINMTSGIFSINIEDDNISVHAIHEDYFYDFDLLKNVVTLNDVNDDNLV